MCNLPLSSSHEGTLHSTESKKFALNAQPLVDGVHMVYFYIGGRRNVEYAFLSFFFFCGEIVWIVANTQAGGQLRSTQQWSLAWPFYRLSVWVA
ncbi:duf890 domain protein [Moniliophthora roreri]|nr:duf890 domain protein [Moniliophthora roreri]